MLLKTAGLCLVLVLCLGVESVVWMRNLEQQWDRQCGHQLGYFVARRLCSLNELGKSSGGIAMLGFLEQWTRLQQVSNDCTNTVKYEPAHGGHFRLFEGCLGVESVVRTLDDSSTRTTLSNRRTLPSCQSFHSHSGFCCCCCILLLHFLHAFSPISHSSLLWMHYHSQRLSRFRVPVKQSQGITTSALMFYLMLNNCGAIDFQDWKLSKCVNDSA